MMPILDGSSDAEVDQDASDGQEEPGAEGPVDSLQDIFPDVVYDSPAEARLDIPDATDGYVPNLLPPVEGPQCGDGHLDEGEECDDRNRLNGDGCDWLCRLGDGDPPTEPDPDAPTYRVSGDPAAIPGWEDLGTDLGVKIPLAWTGSEYATAFFETLEGMVSIRFQRFDESGHITDPGWRYVLPTPDEEVFIDRSLDLLWNGSDFAMFFVDIDRGIVMLRMGPSGKPIGDPVIVEPDPTARTVSGDVLPDGYAIAWVTVEWPPPGGWAGCTGSYPHAPAESVRMRLIDRNGNTAGLPGPVLLMDGAGSIPDVAAGDSAFGVVLNVWPSDEYPSCAFRFVRVDSDLTTLAFSGVLSEGGGWEVVWNGDHWVTAWVHEEGIEPGDPPQEACVANFGPVGSLEGPPACTLVYRSEDAHFGFYARISDASDGLGVIYSERYLTGTLEQLAFQGTDAMGVGTQPPIEIASGFGVSGAAAAIEYNGGGFGILYHSDSGGLVLQRIVYE